MATLFQTLALQIISEKCYETYFYENNFFDGEFHTFNLSISILNSIKK